MSNKSNTLFDSFSDMSDPRIKGKTEYPLIEIIILAISAIIGGADSWTEIELFCKSKITWFKKFLELKNGVPSHDTFGRVFSLIDPEQFRQCFAKWIQSVSNITQGQIIAIDGKTVRHSYDKANNKSAIHMVSAWACEAGLVLGQIKVDEKSNEITAIPKLLEILDVKGCIVTLDAMGCQKKIAKLIKEKHSDYVFSLKGNHGNLHNDVKYFLDAGIKEGFKDISCDYIKTIDADHGRIEKREYWITDNIDWIDEREDWQGLKSIGVVRSKVTEKQTGIETIEIRYFLSSLPNDAQMFANAVRKHWGIENSLHWVLDVSFREDESRVRKDHAPENLAMLRHIAVNMIKKDKSRGSIKAKRKKAGWNEQFLEDLLFHNF